MVIFGDEAGIPPALTAAGKAVKLVVYDPKRDEAQALCRGLSVPSAPHPEKAEREAFLKRLSGLGPRLGVIFSYSRILWPELLEFFPNGAVNLHCSELPRYRGANTLQWTLIQGEIETAATLHYVDRGIDTGPVIAAERVRISEEDTAFTLREKLLKAAGGLLSEWLPRLARGRVEAVPQDEDLARYWPRRSPEDGKIDWSMPDRDIRNLTRALASPWPGAFYLDERGRKVVLDRALSLKEVRALRRAVEGSRERT